MKSKWIKLFLMILLLFPGGAALAQDNPPDGPVYIVQSGDTLWDISQRFGVLMDDLIQVNGIADPGALKAGDQLIIPGLQGIQGILQTETVGFGETLRSLSRRYQVPEAFLLRLNHITSSVELYAGANLIIPKQDSENLGKRVFIGSGQSLLEMAILQGTDPWTFRAMRARVLAHCRGRLRISRSPRCPWFRERRLSSRSRQKPGSPSEAP
jgi:LysM repeat protein